MSYFHTNTNVHLYIRRTFTLMYIDIKIESYIHKCHIFTHIQMSMHTYGVYSHCYIQICMLHM